MQRSTDTLKKLQWVSALTLMVLGTACAPDTALTDEPLGHQEQAQLDPGMKYILSANGTIFAEIVVVHGSIRTTDYYTLRGAMPAASSITLEARTHSGGAPTAYTFAVPSKTFTSTTPHAASSSLYVNNESQFGLSWGFIYNTVLGRWTGSATWYHRTRDLITLPPGRYTLTNNTAASSLTYKAVDSVP
jgi:hypothetical protein